MTADAAQQQARRSYYTFVDRVNQGLRNTLRTIRLNELNFELRRASVQLAISQVELARLQLEEPPRPGVQTVGGSDNRVQNLVGALTQLLNSQNDFLSVWVNYEVQRLSLSFNLGTMLLDAHGQWIDPGHIEASHYRKKLSAQQEQFQENVPAPEEIPTPPPEVSLR